MEVTSTRARWAPDAIRRLRKRTGLSQSKFAPVLGYSSAQSVSDIETERRTPSPSVCRVLDYVDRYGVLS